MNELLFSIARSCIGPSFSSQPFDLNKISSPILRELRSEEKHVEWIIFPV